MRRLNTLCLAACALTGCGGPDRAETGEAGGAEASQASPLRPGRWALTVREEVADRAPVGRSPRMPIPEPRERIVCITPEEAAAPAPEVLLGNINRNECRRDVFHMENGNINGVLNCAGHAENIRQVPTRLWGSYSPEAYSVTAEQRALGLLVVTRIQARRVGECDGGE